MKRVFVLLVALALGCGMASAATTVPGKTGPRVDADANEFPDAGVVLQGHYTSV
jgi:hypothetical protein